MEPVTRMRADRPEKTKIEWRDSSGTFGRRAVVFSPTTAYNRS